MTTSSPQLRQEILDKIAAGNGLEVEIEFLDYQTIHAVEKLKEDHLIKKTTEYSQTGNYKISTKGALSLRAWPFRFLVAVIESAKRHTGKIVWGLIGAVLIAWATWLLGPTLGVGLLMPTDEKGVSSQTDTMENDQ